MKKIYSLAIALLGSSFSLLAQQEAVLHTMRSLPQAHYTNPAVAPEQQFYLGLPGISSTYLSFSNSGFNYNTIFNRDKEGNLIIDLPRFQENLAEKNYLSAIAHTDVLSLGLKINARMYLFMSSTIKANTRFMYPEGLTGLILNGNGAYLGESVSFSPAADHISYLENAIGASYIVNNQLTVGATLKQLKGLANIRTEQSDFSLYTDAQTYALQLTGNMQVLTAGIYGLAEGDSDPANLQYSDFKNNGFALDLGATYKISSRLELGFSALNLGFINWKTDLHEYYMNETEIAFKGLNAQEMANGESGVEEFYDQINEALDLKERKLASYRTGLPTQFYLSTRYQLARNLNASGLLFSEIYNGRFMPAFSAALNKDFGRHLSTTVSYTAVNRSYNNIGAGFSFRFIPFQFYLLSDNFISAPLFYRSAKAFNLRLGLNLVFGYRKTPTKLPYAN